MRCWGLAAQWTRRTVALVLCGVVLLVSVTALALPRLIGGPSGGAASRVSASATGLAARAELSEERFARAHATVPPATPSASATETPPVTPVTPVTPFTPASLADTFHAASQASGVPVGLLEAICYMEGRLSNQGGAPSIDNGFGCMHLVRNDRADTLDQAARETGLSVAQLKRDIAANIRGGAAILRDDALRLSPTHTLPASLGDWYAAVEAYSVTSTPSVARMYADALYQILNGGFSARAETGETITLAPQHAQPNRATPGYVPHATYPSGCGAPDANTDYPGAVDCILNPYVYDCEIVSPGTSTNPCTYDQANRPNDLAISLVVIHDIEGTVQAALSTFQDVSSGVSIHYIVGADGTVYQVLRERDVAWHAGNYWYNQHAIGIEHAGYAATGYSWYSAAEYLASARLTAYLLKKYDIPLDHNHVVGHGDVAASTLALTPNHVDPGPYWMWTYYFSLIHQQGVAYATSQLVANIVALYPPSAAMPNPPGGTFPETSSGNTSYFKLYTSASTRSTLIPQATSDNTEETGNVEPAVTYVYLAKQSDSAGTSDTMYEIWYGESDHLSSGNEYMDGHTAWIAVPPGDAVEGPQSVLTSQGAAPAVPGVTAQAVVQVTGPGTSVYSKPITDASFVIGGAPVGAIFASAFSATEDGTTHLWYEIEYNHRQAWVPATEATLTAVLQPR